MYDKIELDQIFGECVGTYVFFLCILQSTDPLPIAIGLLAAIYMFGKVSGGFFKSTLSLIFHPASLKNSLAKSLFIELD